jgi:mono/diheme cytochrome c family protein
MNPLFTVLLVVVLASCSRVNQQSQDYYSKQSKLRHGIVPLDETPPPTKVSQQIQDESVKRGQKLYENACLKCHGATGLGDGPEAKSLPHPPADLRAAVREVPHFTLYISISQWEGKMPGWKQHFTALERDDLVAYLKTFR